MSTFFMRGIILACFCCSMSAFSTGTIENHNDHWPRQQCSSFDSDPRACQMTPGCDYDWRSNTCNGFANGNNCGQYDGEPRWCQNEPGCEYDWRSGVCFDSGLNPPPQAQCYWYDRDPLACGRIVNCYYDRRLARCLDRTIRP